MLPSVVRVVVLTWIGHSTSSAIAIGVQDVSIPNRDLTLSHFEAGIPASSINSLAISRMPSPRCSATGAQYQRSGMGAKQFADALRVRHLENYDKLQLSHLSRIARGKTMQAWLEKKFESFLPFADRSSRGYHGFVPSSQWLRDLFDKFMELHSQDFDQAMALLPALICAIDHSFKIGRMLAGGRLSSVLKQILVNPRILKVGRAVSADLKYLQEACQSPDPFVGAVDLAQLAKERLVISSAKIVTPPKQTPGPVNPLPENLDPEPGFGELILEEFESAAPHDLAARANVKETLHLERKFVGRKRVQEGGR
ncbi:hypothetical protein B0H11DRAFT_1932613 [Mycena galericulata]|nr:hypothetical protein B0H11DRAFT_1932613 [Mycena galericulata]